MAFLCLCALFSAHAQSNTHVSGHIFDQSTKEPLPFVNVYFKGTSAGTMSDSAGYYSLKSSEDYSTIVFSSIGYLAAEVQVLPGAVQVKDVYLRPDVVNLDEIVVLSGENPAWAIVRQAAANKSRHNKKRLNSYEYDSYTQVRMAMSNITERFASGRAMQQVWVSIDSTALDHDGGSKAMVPVFFSETLSRYFIRNNPRAKREEVQKVRASGLAIDDGSLVAQLTGASYQEYNFNDNWLNILDKDFISPIADGWRLYYDYQIEDTVLVGPDTCYQLEVWPLRQQELAFAGHVWITTAGFALKKLDLRVGRETNINFINAISVEQELTQTARGPWLPNRTRVAIDVDNITWNTAGFYLQFYNSARNWQFDKPRPDQFYQNQILVAEDATTPDEALWLEGRHEPLTESEQNLYAVIDTVKRVPVVRNSVGLLKIIGTGYVKVGKIDVGPWLYAYANNNFEGSTIRLGGRTNEHFSRKYLFQGYAGYGFGDRAMKYGATAKVILSRYPWSTVAVSYRNEAEQVGLRSEDLEDNYIFFAATRWQTYFRPYYHEDVKLTFERELAKGLTQSLRLRNEFFNPQFPFAYKEDAVEAAPTQKNFSLTSITLKTHWAPDERFVQNGNYRVSMGTVRAPAVDLAYTYGFDGLMGSDFQFHKIEAGLQHKLNMGILGVGNYRLNGGWFVNPLPYIVLENHIGNESLFYTDAAFNTMDYFEFVSDRYVALRYEQSFNGFLLNKLPIISRWKWRFFATTNVLYGQLSQANRDIMAETDMSGTPTAGFQGLGHTPYIEAGYGIENILRFLRVDFFHRLTYLDQPGARRFDVKLSMQLEL
jgi:hypothetical protein